jgi:hypothetical protein
MNTVIGFGDKDLHVEENLLVPIAVYAVVRLVDNNAGVITTFRDTHKEAAQWLQERMKQIKHNANREGFSATLENNILTTKGESAMFPESVVTYRIEGISLAMALNYMLERGLGYERFS